MQEAENHPAPFLKLAELRADRDAARGRYDAHRAEVESLQAARERVTATAASLEHPAPPPQPDRRLDCAGREQHAKVHQTLAEQRRDEHAALLAMLPALDAGIEAARAREAAALAELTNQTRIAEIAQAAFRALIGPASIFHGV